jgi:hypothetical protein
MTEPHDRYPPVTVAALQRLPDSSAKAFAIGVALGRFLDQGGSNKRIWRGAEAAASVIDGRRLPAVLEALAISDRQWRRYCADWVARYLAHRCARGVVVLFTKPLLAACPNCKTELLADRLPPSPRPKRGSGFASNDHIMTGAPDASRPLRGTGTSAAPVQERPLTRTNRTQEESFFNGIAVGVTGVETLERPDLPDNNSQTSFEALTEIRAAECLRCGHDHFRGGSCRRPACHCEAGP